MGNLVAHFSLNLKGRLAVSFSCLIISKFVLINTVDDLLLKSSVKKETIFRDRAWKMKSFS